MEKRYYNPYSVYNRIGVSEETQEYVRILRFIPENILVCADSIIPYSVWKSPEDYFEGEKPVCILDATNDLECRKLFAEVDFTDIKKFSLDHYIRYVNHKYIRHSPLYLYDLYNSEAHIEINDSKIIFWFDGVYNKNNNYDIIKDHAYIPSLKVSFEEISGLICKLRSGTETVKAGASSIDAKTTMIDVKDQAKFAEFLCGINHLEPYYLNNYNNAVYIILLMPYNDKLILEFKYGNIKIEEW